MYGKTKNTKNSIFKRCYIFAVYNFIIFFSENEPTQSFKNKSG